MKNKSIITIIIVITLLLLTTGQTAIGAVRDINTNTVEGTNTIKQENYYRGYTFSEDSPAHIKSDMKDIIDKVYIEKAKLYLMEQKEKELLEKMDITAIQREIGLNAIYGNELTLLREEIRPQRFLTLELLNFEDSSYAYCLKDLDIVVEQVEILKEVEKIVSNN